MACVKPACSVRDNNNLKKGIEVSTHDNNTPSPEERSRIVEDAIKHSGLNGDVSTKLTIRQELMSRAWDVNQLVQQRCRPTMKAVKERGTYRYEDAQDFVYKLFRDEYNKWSKEELCEVVSMMCSGLAMSDVEQFMKE